ncbi:hypothetical protein AUP68_04562 [Ilyonectria robusta]
MLERVVPEGGATLAGTFLPQGTIVGVNPWVIGRDKAVYGENANDFVPERWLYNDAVSLKAMERNFFAVCCPSTKCICQGFANAALAFQFGAGSRSCLGKNASLMEMSKLVPQLLRNFHFELENPDAEWKLTGYWFVKQTGLICRQEDRLGSQLSHCLRHRHPERDRLRRPCTVSKSCSETTLHSLKTPFRLRSPPLPIVRDAKETSLHTHSRFVASQCLCSLLSCSLETCTGVDGRRVSCVVDLDAERGVYVAKLGRRFSFDIVSVAFLLSFARMFGGPIWAFLQGHFAVR